MPIDCEDVKIEPALIPMDSEKFQKGNNANKARLDVTSLQDDCGVRLSGS